MNVDSPRLISICLVAALVLSLTVQSRSEGNLRGNQTKTSSRKNDSGEFPVLVGMYIMICHEYDCFFKAQSSCFLAVEQLMSLHVASCSLFLRSGVYLVKFEVFGNRMKLQPLNQKYSNFSR